MSSEVSSFTSKEELISWITKGNKVTFHFFWNLLPSSSTKPDSSCFSLWYPSPIEINNIHYASAQHYLMAEKARIFKNSKIEAQIIESTEPHVATMLGHQLGKEHENTWKKCRFETALKANLEKFTQYIELGDYLRNTNNAILAEANPHDLLWSIGMSAEDKKAKTPPRWKGQNLLGFTLMAARHQLSEPNHA